MKIPRILAVPIFVIIVAAFSFLVGFIAHLFGAYNPTAWGAFTLIGVFGLLTLFVWGRQIYWRITKSGDYEHLRKKE